MDLPEYQTTKGLMYGALGLSNIIPLTIVLYYMMFSDELSSFLPFEKAFIGIIIMGILYLIGLAFYITRFPECKYPGKFDFAFSSHNIWHIFVLAAAV